MYSGNYYAFDFFYTFLHRAPTSSECDFLQFPIELGNMIKYTVKII